MSEYEYDPQVGEIWILGGLPERRPSAHNMDEDGNLRLALNCWSELNDQKIRVMEVVPNPGSRSRTLARVCTYKVHALDFDPPHGHDKLWARVSRSYLKERLTDEKGFLPRKNCCNPFAGLCDLCKAEFRLEMLRKDKVYNRWTKLWT